MTTSKPGAASESAVGATFRYLLLRTAKRVSGHRLISKSRALKQAGLYEIVGMPIRAAIAATAAFFATSLATSLTKLPPLSQSG